METKREKKNKQQVCEVSIKDWLAGCQLYSYNIFGHRFILNGNWHPYRKMSTLLDEKQKMR